MPQTSLEQYVEALDKAHLLTRYTEEKRVDELPGLMEAHPDTAIYVEKVKDCAFPFLANAYGVASMYASALGVDSKDIAIEVARRTELRQKPKLVNNAPCKDVIIKGDDVDLTIFPLFLDHLRDGHAYFSDTRVVSRDPDTGLIDQGFYRFMYRTKNSTSIDLRFDSHFARINALHYQKLGKDMPIAVVIGGPVLDKVASIASSPGVDDWDILGGFYGAAAEIIKCETNDLTVPANSEIVLEGRVIITEGWIHDEGPYGEYTGTYGGGLPHNNRFVVDCITYRKGAIYQYATIGGLHPGRTDTINCVSPALEADLYAALKNAGILVQNIHMPPAGCGAIAYASIKTRGGGDAKQTLAIMLSGSRQPFIKGAYVFDEDVDIFEDERVKWAEAWRFNPATGVVTLPAQNVVPLDPTIGTDHPPVAGSKIGFDCTIPLVGHVDHYSFEAATVSEPLKLNGGKPLAEGEVVKQMESFIREKPRTWKEVLEHFAGQSYPGLYRAFGELRPKLGCMADQPPFYPYTFADSDFVYGRTMRN